MSFLIRFASAGFLLLTAAMAVAQVQLGSDVLAASGFRELQGKRVGLITNPSGVNRAGESTIDLLRHSPEVKLIALFGPEHGVYGDVRAGENIGERTDRRTGLKVHSLYGATRKPTPEMLGGLDALVYDLQDTGVRSYTFISTMGLAMEACAQGGLEFVVLDRPNPLGGERVEGPMVEERFRSFVGQWDVPYVYGMTCGELARMINGEGWIRKPCKLSVVPMTGWRRSMVWRDTGLPWMPTSPNIPRADSPIFYAATGLFGEIAGGSGASIGTRLRRPFECVIAPWLDAEKLSGAMNSYGLQGVRFPTFSVMFEGKRLQGVSLKFTEPARAPLVALNFYLLDGIKRVSGRDLFWEALKAKKDFQMLDKVSGGDATRKALLTGRSAADIVNSWLPGEDAFRQQREKYLLYGVEPPPAPKPVAQTKPADPPKPAPSPARPPSTAPELLVITVARGDTADKIAKDFGTTVSEIALANPGTNLIRIKAGQKLKIPRTPSK